MPCQTNPGTSYLLDVYGSYHRASGNSRCVLPLGMEPPTRANCKGRSSGPQPTSRPLPHSGTSTSPRVDRASSLPPPGLAIDDPGRERLHPCLSAEVGPRIDALGVTLHVRNLLRRGPEPGLLLLAGRSPECSVHHRFRVGEVLRERGLIARRSREGSGNTRRRRRRRRRQRALRSWRAGSCSSPASGSAPRADASRGPPGLRSR